MGVAVAIGARGGVRDRIRGDLGRREKDGRYRRGPPRIIIVVVVVVVAVAVSVRRAKSIPVHDDVRISLCQAHDAPDDVRTLVPSHDRSIGSSNLESIVVVAVAIDDTWADGKARVRCYVRGFQPLFGH